MGLNIVTATHIPRSHYLPLVRKMASDCDYDPDLDPTKDTGRHNLDHELGTPEDYEGILDWRVDCTGKLVVTRSAAQS